MEPTTQLYMRYSALDPRALTCDTTVLTVDRDVEGRTYVVLRETTVHPQGGGQLADDALIGAARVVDARRERDTGRILHFIDGPTPSVGDVVRVVVKEETRLRNAALHSAGHLLALLADRYVTGVTIRAGHHYPNEARVAGPCTTSPDLASVTPLLQEHAEEAIRQAWPITSVFLATRREIAVGDGKPEGCGGTHLAHCGLLRDLKVLKVNHQKGELRIRYTVLGA
ncbi:MAG: hypothetical protein NFW16_20195 [Candidatus Accumulibacter sp.]|uniref:hypothetical protein n=1 Tax=Accumulibacter sp. TaxID=2053492 RepID=UPI0025834D38|nr:hypothetical protein [Accumulibacter sp.]MCM8623988.1 hypothetical protein [Accumulibacter sp.]